MRKLSTNFVNIRWSFSHRWLNKYAIHWKFMTTCELWNSIIVLTFKTSLVITPPSRTHQRHYHALPTKIDMWSTSLIKRRIEYLPKALLARCSKIILFKFLLEKVSRWFENDYIHEIEYSWSVNMGKTGSILAVYCV